MKFKDSQRFDLKQTLKHDFLQSSIFHVIFLETAEATKYNKNWKDKGVHCDLPTSRWT